MNSWQFTPISYLYFLSVCTCILVAIIAWRKSPKRTARLFSITAISIGIWSIGYFLGVFNKDIVIKLFMLRVEFLGVYFSGYLWLLFTAAYTHQNKWLKPKVVIALAVIPVLSFSQVLLLDYHDFFYKSISIDEIDGFIVFNKVYGPGFYIAALFGYLQVIAGMVLILRNMYRTSPVFRGQNFIIVFAIISMLLPNFLYLLGRNPIKPYDPSSLSFTFANILFIFAFFNFQFLDIVPIAYNLIFKNLKNGVLILDKKSRVIEMNSAAEHILNCTLKKSKGKSVITLFPDSKESITQSLNKDEIKTEVKIGSDENFYELQVSALKDNSDKVIGKIFLLYDISEQKNAYEELDAFSRTVAHDLKSPLSTVIGFSEILSKNTVEKEEHDDYLSNISVSAKKMVGIIESLLLLAKIRHLKKLPKTKLNTEQIVDSAISRLSYLIAEHNAKIIKPDNWLEVEGYSEWVEEVWVNYISNAIKYGGESPIVILSSHYDGDMVKMEVKDNGDGISEEDQAILFTEFTRLYKHQNAISGHGLGLSIVKRIINKLGGQVGVESKPGSGSIFFFTLPVT